MSFSPKRVSAIAIVTTLLLTALGACQKDLEQEQLTPDEKQLLQKLEGMSEAELREWKRKTQERLDRVVDEAGEPSGDYQDNSVRQFPKE